MEIKKLFKATDMDCLIVHGEVAKLSSLFASVDETIDVKVDAFINAIEDSKNISFLKICDEWYGTDAVNVVKVLSASEYVCDSENFDLSLRLRFVKTSNERFVMKASVIHEVGKEKKK